MLITVHMHNSDILQMPLHDRQKSLRRSVWYCPHHPQCWRLTCINHVSDAAEVGEKCAVQAYQCLRDICSRRLGNVDAPLLLGGPGVTVQIDESLFHHKPKYHRGHPAAQEVWDIAVPTNTSVPPIASRIASISQRTSHHTSSETSYSLSWGTSTYM